MNPLTLMLSPPHRPGLAIKRALIGGLTAVAVTLALAPLAPTATAAPTD